MITRGAAKGKQREVTGSVSLIMPDGTEYPSKETDRKLQEITGLTKAAVKEPAATVKEKKKVLVKEAVTAPKKTRKTVAKETA